MSSTFNPADLRTVHLVPLTAYHTDGTLNGDAYSSHIADMYAAGMRVYLPAAGTSEFHSLAADEIVEIVKLTRDATGPDARIFAPVGLQIGHAIDVGKRSMDAGASGIMFMPFGHPYMSDVGAKEYYLEVINQVEAPTLIYKKGPIPSNQLLLELAQHPHVVGVKYAVNEMHEFRKVVAADRDGCSAANATSAADSVGVEWLCGSAERFAPYYMLAGAPGYTTGAGNLCPQLTLAMHAAFTAGQYDEGMRLQRLILPIEDYRAREGDSYNISMLKHALKLLDKDFGLPRAPMRQLTEAECAEIDAMMGPILEAESQMRGELSTVGLAAG